MPKPDYYAKRLEVKLGVFSKLKTKKTATLSTLEVRYREQKYLQYASLCFSAIHATCTEYRVSLHTCVHMYRKYLPTNYPYVIIGYIFVERSKDEEPLSNLYAREILIDPEKQIEIELKEFWAII